jgi:hypothetical protein
MSPDGLADEADIHNETWRINLNLTTVITGPCQWGNRLQHVNVIRSDCEVFSFLVLCFVTMAMT